MTTAEDTERPAADPAAESTPDGHAEGTGDQDERDQPQDVWSARRDLVDHSPRTMKVGDRARFGGGLVAGDQHGVSGGQVTGDVIMGGKTEIHHWSFTGFGATATPSGEIPRSTLDRLTASFVADEETVAALLDRLRRDRVLVLTGARCTGRRTAALMLLHRLGVSGVHALDRDTTPAALAEQCTAPGDRSGPHGRGYILSDLVTRRGSPLREQHLLAARERLAEQDAHLVITLGSTAVREEDVPAAEWRPPSAADVLAAHLRTHTDSATAAELLTLPDVKDFLDRGHQLREVAAFARLLARYAAGAADSGALAGFSLLSLENQVREWFEADPDTVHLRDKAFLVALAAFDGGPYALTAELSDLLYRFLQKTENAAVVPEVPVFGTHVGKRLQLARAERFEDDEHTEWGPVTQQKAQFTDERAPLVLLRELWTGHPSARPALVEWLRRLAEDGRPLVRTRAASTVAVLARTDLPSTMALIVEPWATSNRFRQRLVAVNSLTLAHHIGTPNVPRILDDWSEAEDRRLRWVAVRAYGLIGPELPDQALAALRAAIRRLYADSEAPDDFDLEMADELAGAVELLLLSATGDLVLDRLREHLDDDRAVRGLTLDGFLRACHQTRDDPGGDGMPLVLAWYAETAGLPAADGIVHLWRQMLGDPHTTRPALDELRRWVLTADRAVTTEWVLAALLPRLAVTDPEYQRLSHLLRTMPGEDGAPPPEVAARLLTALPPR